MDRRTKLGPLGVLGALAAAFSAPALARGDAEVAKVLLPRGPYVTLAVPRGTQDLGRLDSPTFDRLHANLRYRATHLTAFFVEPGTTETIIPEEGRALPTWLMRLPLYHAGYQVRIPLRWHGRSFDYAAFGELKREIAADRNVPEEAGLRDLVAAADAPPLDYGLTLLPAIVEELGAQWSSEEVFMKPYLETGTLMSGLAAVRVTSPSWEEARLLVGTWSLLQVRSTALELVVYESVEPSEGISPNRVERLKGRTLEWAEAVREDWSYRFPPLDRVMLRRLANPNFVLYVAGANKWPLLVVTVGVAVLILALGSRLPTAVPFLLSFLPAAAGAVLFLHALQRGAGILVGVVGPLFSPRHDAGVSSIFTEQVSILVLAAAATIVLALLAAFAHWRAPQ